MNQTEAIPMTDTAAQLTERLRRPAGIRSLTLGDTKLTYVPDGVALLNGRLLLPEASDDDWARHAEYLDDAGCVVASVGGLLVERAGRAMLIDAGMGPWSVGPPLNPYGTTTGGALLENLALLGRTPADIESIALTHLHPDHFGWAWHPAVGSEQPPFTEAEYLLPDPEWADRHFLEEHGLGNMLKPLESRVRTVVDGEEVFPGVTVRFAPGHSVGHAAYVVSDGGQEVIAFGDAFHSPVQIIHPSWEATVDHDRAQAAKLRLNLVLELAQSNTIGFGIHFADVPFGQVHFDNNMARWQPLDA
jgi:glyoxylase-like metal-dependent hydrolase (beta-lactamase superfamily II)